MRVLHITDFYPPVVGGLERYVQSLAHESRASGLEVAVATQPHASASASGEVDDVQVFRMTSSSSKYLARAYADKDRPFLPPAPDPAVRSQLRDIISTWHPDIIQSHGWISFSAAASVKNTGVPLLVTLHDYGLMCSTRTLLRDGELCSGPGIQKCAACATQHYGLVKGIGLASLTAWSRPLLKHASGFIAVSHSVAATYRPYLPQQTPTHVIPIFMSTDFSIAPRPDWLPDGDYVAFVGVLSPYKGIETILRVAKAMPEQQFVVAGIRHDDTPTRVPANVTVRYNVPHAEVMSIYTHAAAALVPSEWQEPGGTVAMEALRVGTPVIATNLGGLPEVVLDGVNGLIIPARDPKALQAAITRLVDSPELRAQMSAAALGSSDRYAARSIMDDLVGVYEATVAAYAKGQHS
jgi:glycosyltransferase involved in cell wall biosynthesis